MEKTLIPIFFTIDDGYAPYLGVAIKSLIDNASKDYRYRIHIIQEGLTDKYKGYLADMATDDCEIEFCEMEESWISEVTSTDTNSVRTTSR